MLASRLAVARSDDGWARGLGSSRCRNQTNKRLGMSVPATEVDLVPAPALSMPPQCSRIVEISFRDSGGVPGLVTAYPSVGATIGCLVPAPWTRHGQAEESRHGNGAERLLLDHGATGGSGERNRGQPAHHRGGVVRRVGDRPR